MEGERGEGEAEIEGGMDRQIRSKEGGRKGDGGRRWRVSWQHQASSFKNSSYLRSALYGVWERA